MSSFRLRIVTPEGSAFDGEAEAILLPTTEGYVSIRAGHADYIAVLEIGMVTVTQNGQERRAACGGGFLNVEHGEAGLVATTFEYAESIDVARAQEAKRRAKELMEAAEDEKQLQSAKAKLFRATNRLRVAGAE